MKTIMFFICMFQKLNAELPFQYIISLIMKIVPWWREKGSYASRGIQKGNNINV